MALPRGPALPALLLGLLSFGLYAGTLAHEFVWDDPFLLERLDALVAEGGVGRIFSSDFRMRESLGYYRPVVNLSLLADRVVSGGSPVGYHLTNVALNAACTAALFVLLSSLTASRAKAFAGALLFAAHPAHVESVAFVAGRTDLLAAAFVLGAALVWARDRAAPAPSASRVALGSGLYLLALLSKESAVLAPAALLAMNPADREAPASLGPRPGRRLLPWLLGWSAALASYAALRFLVAGVGAGVSAPLLEGGRASLPGLAATAAAKFLLYAKIVVVPVGLSAWYTTRHLTPDALSLLALAVLLLLAYRVARTGSPRLVVWAGAWFVLLLLPAMAGSGAAVAADRYLYLPSAAVCALAGCALASFEAPRQPWLRALPAALLIGAFAILSAARTGIWRDNLSLFTSIVASSPDSAEARGNLGYLLWKENRPAEAVAEYRAALALNPNLPRTWFDLGEVYFESGRWQEAADAYRRATQFTRSAAIDYRRLSARLAESSANLGRGSASSRE